MAYTSKELRYARCRATSHKWNDPPTILDWPVCSRREVCRNCGSKRLIEWDRRTGKSLHRPYIYDYADGYVRYGQGRMKKDDARLELMDLEFGIDTRKRPKRKAA